ncbi:hypothetical protein KPL71_001755 [Citrus sinensis]|uniref:Uncharacterized protein n=1 Tax=Citrus sinensis TaxID=2711 RepID=A0ACB8NZ39_CITSI|nr:hypothetical protein KPL71_001755 [Citrus sinensis]
MSGVLVFALFLFEILAIATISISFCNGSSYHGGCLESERGALLRLKRDLKDPSNRLASWTGSGDCCAWTGVVCDNMTSHILHLDLRNPFNYSKESEYDAIRGTALVGDRIPRFVGSMGNLRYLNFSGTRIGGMIPQQLGNLSNLQFLDLSSNYLLYVDNFLWLSGLSFLEHLDLRSVNLSKAFDWLMV